MLLDQLLDIDEIGCYVAHWLRLVQAGKQALVLFCQVIDVLSTEPTVDNVSILIHLDQILLNAVNARPYLLRCRCRFKSQ